MSRSQWHRAGGGTLLAGLCASLAVTAPSALHAGGPPSSTGQAFDLALGGAEVADSLSAYWSAELPSRYGVDYADASGIRAYGSGGIPPVACATSTEDMAYRAFYCPADRAIAYDTRLVELLAMDHGPVTPIVMLAHEWAHHLQSLLGTGGVSKQQELQADCLAGLYIRRLVDAGHLGGIDVGQGMNLMFRLGDDPATTDDWFDPEVHGWSNERRQALGAAYVTDDERYGTAYERWDEPGPVVIDGDVVINPGPDVHWAGDQSRGFRFPLPGGDVELAVLRGVTGGASDALRSELAIRFPVGLDLGTIDDGWLSAFGWARGEGAGVAFAGHRTLGGPRQVGRALLQVLPDGSAHVLLSAADAAGVGMVGTGDALLALLWGYCDPSAPVPANCLPGGASVGLPTPPPFAEPSFVPRPTFGPRATQRPVPPRSEIPDRMAGRLRRKVPSELRGSCHRFREREDPAAFALGVVAAVDCDPLVLGIEEIAFYVYDDVSRLEAQFDQRIVDLNGTVKSRRSACYAGTRGWRSWEHGRIACWTSRSGDGKAHIRWTDHRDLTYGILQASDGDLEILFAYWFTEYGL